MSIQTTTEDYKLLTNSEFVNEIVNYYKKQSQSNLDKKKPKKGNQLFMVHKDKNALDYSLVDEKKNETISTLIYLPYTYNIVELVNNLKTEYRLQNTNLIESLEACSVKMSIEDLETVKNLKFIIDKLNGIFMKKILHSQNIKNKLIEKEAILMKKDRELFSRLDMENIESMEDYIFHKQSISNSIDKIGNTIVKPGMLGIFDNKQIEILEISEGNYKIKKDDGSTQIVSRGQIKIIEGIRNQIKNLKILSNYVSLDIIMNSLEDNLLAKELLLQKLNIQLDDNDILKRPRKEVIKISKVLEKPLAKIIFDDKYFYTTIDKNLLYNPDNVIEISSILSKSDCINKLATNDKSYLFKVDDFTFNSVQIYHKACQFYNRQDLLYDIRMEYNDFFIKFTKEYLGVDSMYDLNISEINEILMYNTYEKPFDWSRNYVDRASLSSIYLRKAIYNKIIQNESLKTCLINTNDAMLLEKVSKGSFRVMNELMEVRYFLQNGIVPNYIDFNYDPKILMNFNSRYKQLDEIDYKTLLNVLIDLNSYSKKTANIDKPNPFIEIELLYKEKEPIRPFNLEMVRTLLYSYQGQYIYEVFKMNSDSSFERICNLNPEFTENLELVSFIYMFVRLEDKLIDRIEENDKKLRRNQQIAEKEKYDISNRKIKEQLEVRVRLMKYLSNIWLDGRNDSLYISIANNLASQNKYPCNFQNTIDVRSKFSNNLTKLNNKLVHLDASKELLNEVVNLYKLWKPDDDIKANEIMDRVNVDIHLELSLLSRYLGANISIIEIEKVTEIQYLDVREKIDVIA